LAGSNARYERTKRRAAEQLPREDNDRIFREQMEIICQSKIGVMVCGLLHEVAQETVNEVDQLLRLSQILLLLTV